MGPGPGGLGIFLGNLSCRAWDMTDTVFTTQPRVAQHLPFPENAPLITTATKAGPLVQAVRDCASLQVCGAGVRAVAGPVRRVGSAQGQCRHIVRVDQTVCVLACAAGTLTKLSVCWPALPLHVLAACRRRCASPRS
jgi:hypothetical protein